jgi:Transposase DDE domain group 1
MPRAQYYHGRRCTIGGEYSASSLSRWGFFPAILMYLRTHDLPKRLEAITLATAANGVYSTVGKRMSLVTRFLLGIARISHSDRSLAGESALARMLGMARFPSSDTLSALIKKVTLCHVKQVDRITHAFLTEQARFKDLPVIADLDLSAKSTEGRKRQGATPGHNPQHQGRDCSQWAVAFASGLVIWQQLWRGCTSGHSVVKPAVEALRERWPQVGILRLDGGFLSTKVLTYLVPEGIGFLSKAGCKLASIRTLLEQTPSTAWQSQSEHTRLHRCGQVQLLKDFPALVTVVLVECRRRQKKMKKGRLRWRTKTFYYAIVTDQHHWSTAQIYETYKARWAIENSFKETSQSFSSGKLPSSKLRGNQFFLALLSVVYKLMQFFKRDCLPKGYRALSFATVRRHFLEQAVTIEDHGDGLILLILSEDYPLKETANMMVRKALAA